MIERRFIQCDVFGEASLMGNGLAVVVDGSGLNDRSMQEFSAWTNLSETTFLLPPTNADADYKVRIFTPTRELDFAGHPTLGSCAAWLHTGGAPKRGKTVVQECNIGNIVIDLAGDLPAFVAPPTRVDAMTAQAQGRILAALEIDPQMVTSAVILNNGSIWHLLELQSAEALFQVDAGLTAALHDMGIGLLGVSTPGAASQYDIRMLSDRSPRNEDPITGSLNAAVGMWLLGRGRLNGPTIMAQGVKVGRNGRVYLVPGPVGSGQVLVAGRTQIVIEGKVRL